MASSERLTYHCGMDYLVHKKPTTAREWLIDAGIALSAFVLGCLQIWLSSEGMFGVDLLYRNMLGGQVAPSSVSAYFVTALITLPLVFRRRVPWPVFVFVTLVFVLTQAQFRGGFTLAILGPAVALFTIGSECSRTEVVAASVVALLGFLIAGSPAKNANLALLLRIQNVAFVLIAALAGFGIRTYRDYLSEARKRIADAERSKEEEAARRVEEERVRIAREIHDITAHSLSAVNIQATAAERLIDRDPEAAKEAIGTVRSTSKQALDEIRSMIGVLRNDSKAETAPTNGTDRMQDIVDYLTQADIATTFDRSDYQKSSVPAYVDVALFGIVREAATNIVRHSHASHVYLTLSSDAQSAHAIIRDDGVGLNGAAPAGSTGHGIQGMAERVNVLGGVFTYGNDPAGGLRIDATIPLSMKNDSVQTEEPLSDPFEL